MTVKPTLIKNTLFSKEKNYKFCSVCEVYKQTTAFHINSDTCRKCKNEASEQARWDFKRSVEPIFIAPVIDFRFSQLQSANYRKHNPTPLDKWLIMLAKRQTIISNIKQEDYYDKQALLDKQEDSW